ncbi:DUF4150 domain-containing protein [Serratia marcescens]|uniref:DUF4150 domain-containing protein n=1 Tax=Serratia marcescens TaxID=615 RepID=A0A939NKS6_SERMA|nr:DUF4150 domain-containing protein [Serratia marcescens]
MTCGGLYVCQQPNDRRGPGVSDVCLTPSRRRCPCPRISPRADRHPERVQHSVRRHPGAQHGNGDALTNGDNPGVATGVASGTVMGPSRHLTGAFTVAAQRHWPPG